MTNPSKSITSTFTVVDGVKVYDFQQCLAYIESQGKSIYGQHYKINEGDIPTIYKLLIYMIQDAETAQTLNLNLQQGILLSGPIGCGKTSIMQLIKPFALPRADYRIKTCREIAFEFAKNGYKALQPYSQEPSGQNRLQGYCFDDLGAEQQIKHFGNDCNVMAEILLSRYDHYTLNKSLTHITTNLSASEIEKHYGNRLRSRMRNMFNLISFPNDSKDKR
jgi:DNA replication protein DnaC